MTEKQFRIIEEDIWISYYGGTGQLISDGECEFHIWGRKETAQKVCDKLNEQYEQIQTLEKENTELKTSLSKLGGKYVGKGFSNKMTIAKLEKENEKLKGSLNFCKKNVKRLHDDKKELINENELLKQQLNDLQTFDDEDFIEIEHINNIYKKLGFQGVIDYAKDNLQQYGAVREVEKGLWVMVTGGWSEHEMWLDCLNSFVSMFGMKHYCAYERGGAFYYTEKPHDKIEIILKGDV